MVNQYPHSVTITPKIDPVQDGQSGDFAAPVSGTVKTSDCRLEPAGDNPVITGENGDAVKFRFILYMPPISEQYRFGDLVDVTLSNGSQMTGTLKLQSNGQFNTRLWV